MPPFTQPRTESVIFSGACKSLFSNKLIAIFSNKSTQLLACVTLDNAIMAHHGPSNRLLAAWKKHNLFSFASLALKM